MNGAPPLISFRVSFLRRRFRPHARLKVRPLDAAPLANVALLLFMFLILNSAFVIQPGIIVNLPPSFFQSGLPYGAMVLAVSQEGLMFFNDEQVALEGLAFVLIGAVRRNPGSALVIEADERVSHSRLVHIYNVAAAAGIARVALATRPLQEVGSKR